MHSQALKLNQYLFEPEKIKASDEKFIPSFIYSTYELNKLIDYLFDFQKEYPVCKTINRLLISTFNFKCLIPIAKQEQIDELFRKMVAEVDYAEKQLSLLEEGKMESYLLKSAIQYVLQSIKFSMEEDNDTHAKAIKNQWLNSPLAALLLSRK